MITPSFNLTATERVLPSMALDFTTASLDSRVTFTRSGGTATYTDSDGYIASAGVDEPRFDYDPLTLSCKGLLIEESRTNLFTHSDSIDNAAWTLYKVTITAGAITAPDGNLTADKMVEGTATDTHRISQYPATIGVTYTISVFAKKAERDHVQFSGVGTSNCVFDLTNGTVVDIGAFTSASIEEFQNGWYRCVATVTAASTGAFRIGLYNGAANYTGDGSSGAYFWGAQLEEGAFATSYIPTTTAQVTRTADVATMTGTDFSDWFNSAEGTFSATATVPAITGLNMRFISANDGTSSNRIDLYGITNTQLRVVNSGSVQASVTSGTIASYQERTSVGAYKADSFATATNADSVSTDTSGTVPTVDQLYIGRATVSNATYCNGTIKQINYWQQRLTDNEVVAFSKGL